MTASKRLEDLTPEQQTKFLADPKRLKSDGKDGMKSPFFEITPGIIGDGAYDRPLIREKKAVIVVVWGRDKNGQVRIGMIKQKRPPADDPRQPGTNDHPPMLFAQPVMGYFDSDEKIEEAALREKREEAGASRVIGVEHIPFPKFNVEPNTFASWHEVCFVEIDLSTVDPSHSSAEEYISGTEYMTVPELLKRIADGQGEDGAWYRGSGTTLGPLMIFFATHPELFSY